MSAWFAKEEDLREMLGVGLGIETCCGPPVTCASFQATNNFIYALIQMISLNDLVFIFHKLN